MLTRGIGEVAVGQWPWIAPGWWPLGGWPLGGDDGPWQALGGWLLADGSQEVALEVAGSNTFHGGCSGDNHLRVAWCCETTFMEWRVFGYSL